MVLCDISPPPTGFENKATIPCPNTASLNLLVYNMVGYTSLDSVTQILLLFVFQLFVACLLSFPVWSFWASWMCSLMFSSNKGSLGPLFLQIYLPASMSLLSFWIGYLPVCLCWHPWWYPTGLWGLLSYFILLYFCFSNCIISTDLKFTDSFFCLIKPDLEAPQ